jgi:hypothetical protein
MDNIVTTDNILRKKYNDISGHLKLLIFSLCLLIYAIFFCSLKSYKNNI